MEVLAHSCPSVNTLEWTSYLIWCYYITGCCYIWWHITISSTARHMVALLYGKCLYGYAATSYLSAWRYYPLIYYYLLTYHKTSSSLLLHWTTILHFLLWHYDAISSNVIIKLCYGHNYETYQDFIIVYIFTLMLWCYMIKLYSFVKYLHHLLQLPSYITTQILHLLWTLFICQQWTWTLNYIHAEYGPMSSRRIWISFMHHYIFMPIMDTHIHPNDVYICRLWKYFSNCSHDVTTSYRRTLNYYCTTMSSWTATTSHYIFVID